MHAAALTSSLLRALVLRDWLPSLRGRAGVNLHPGSGGTETEKEGRRGGGEVDFHQLRLNQSLSAFNL